MKDTTQNILIFDRKEISLMFLFMILLSITSFSLGVKVGKHHRFFSAGITKTDIEKVELKSKQESEVEGLTQKAPFKPLEKEKLVDETYKKLKEEFQKLPTTQEAHPEATVEQKEHEATPASPEETSHAAPASSHEEAITLPAGEHEKVTSPSGKFTIQLASLPDKEEAKRFAAGLKVRGYGPLINEVKVENKVWYRVGLGVFDTVSMAKEYIQKESDLFNGQDYIITEI